MRWWLVVAVALARRRSLEEVVAATLCLCRQRWQTDLTRLLLEPQARLVRRARRRASMGQWLVQAAMVGQTDKLVVPARTAAVRATRRSLGPVEISDLVVIGKVIPEALAPRRMVEATRSMLAVVVLVLVG